MKDNAVSKVGLFSSMICVVHCVFAPFLSTIIPFFGIEAGGRYVEVFFWLLCLVVIFWHAFKTSGIFRCCLLVVAIIGTTGLLTHHHLLLDCGFCGVSLAMCYGLFTKRVPHVCG